MIDYKYKARNASGDIVTASVQADSPQAAAKLLTRQNLFPLDITPVTEGGVLGSLNLGNKVKAKDRVLFTRQLSTLINAGLPLARALHTVRDQIAGRGLQKIVDEVAAAVEGGTTLADAFSAHPKVFNQIYVSMVAAGETSGTLDKTLLRLANQQEKDAAVASKIRSAMIYPAIVMVLIIGVIVLMIVNVVPQVADLYKGLHKELPLPTRFLIWLSKVFINDWWVLLILGIVAALGLRSLLATEAAHLQIDRLKLKIPIFGKLFHKVYMARFARTMNSLLASGIPMLQAMETVRNGAGNRLVAKDVDAAMTQVRGGKALSDSLEHSPTFLALVPQMTKIGEESGEIDEMLGRVATYYEDEVDEEVANLSTTLEPIMMVVLGGMVVAVLAAVLGPVYGLVGSGDLSNTSTPASQTTK